MPRGQPWVAEKAEALRLRQEERLSYRRIHDATGVPMGTLSLWLRGVTVDRNEVVAKPRTPHKKARGAESKFHAVVACIELSRHRKSKIAEAAVLFRLALHGFDPYTSVFDGDKIDWIVTHPRAARMIRIEVRWTKKEKHGLPLVSLTRQMGTGARIARRYRDEDFDFMVGYDLFSDTAYVFSMEELQANRRCVTVRPDAAERWDKLLCVGT